MNRMSLLHIISVLFLVLSTTGYSQSTVVDDSFFSPALGETRLVDVYLPSGYNPDDSTVRYPVIYFLHGGASDQDSYGFITSHLDQLIANRRIEPVIVVKPDGSVGPYAGSFYTNSVLYGRFEDYMVEDVVNYIDSKYNTLATRDKRCIMGHSMGGNGAAALALKHPNVYRGVASHSGGLDLNQWPTSGWIARILAENGGRGPFRYDAGIFSSTLFTLAGAFSPNLANAPHSVDLPIDNSGKIVDSTFAKWLLHSPSNLAANLPTDSNLAIYFDCGTRDDFLLFPFNTGFADSLKKLGHPYTFRSYTGDHFNQLGSRIPIALAFLDSVMRVVPTSVARLDQSDKMPQSITLYQSFPNPLQASTFNLESTIRYDLRQTGNVTLQVYNINGQLIRTLIDNKHHPVGSYRAHWDMKDDKGSAVTNGIYFYVMQSGNYQQTRKILFLK